jgi:hypothetical protein
MLIHHADNKWAHLLAYVTEMVNQRLLLQCEYLSAAKCCSHAKSTSYVAHLWMLRPNVKRLALTF